ncbi:TCR gamma alternate reading frame protein [Nothoprocta perdicaria]|uniref:TCR gamma alternate reading frame protein n=1 Tax=Nothoprocta perdicaria TaxID=30464 RepID=UPI000E1BB886|nr:TCR gamma alternate reading frame protein [Nothoprocta perdicaria]
MLLLTSLMVSLVWSYGFAQEIPQQSPISITKSRKSARMSCKITTLLESFDSTVIHWYQQKDGNPPKRLLYFSQGKTFVESGFQEDRYLAEKVSGQDRCVLTIKDVTPDDAATYYCAYWWWYADVKVFGSGTKLIVSDKGYSPPKNHEVLSSENENKLTYVCLVEKFYPEVIRVTWTDGKKEVTDNVEKGEIWKSADDGQYSIGSWLTVSKENKNKKYSCKYEHESGTHSFDTFKEDLTTTAENEDCNAGNSTIFSGDHLIHRTAYLVYIVLLLKSFMYYVIVLFFIYRMRTPAKQHGKKT